jgi:hypothetical protein
MKKIALIILLLQGCSEPDIPQNVFGEWSISWQADEYFRVGQLVLNNDYTGTINIEQNPAAFILPNKEKIEFTWHFDEQFLKLRRLDNDLELTYVVSEITDKQIAMVFADDIIVRISR